VPGTALVIAKAPHPGRVKTRLVPRLDPAQAARLHEALLLDTLDGCRREARAGVLHPAGEAEAIAACVGASVPLVAQRGSGLAAALEGALAAATDEEPVAVVSSDVPGVPVGALRRTFGALRAGADVVLGPAADGGYWLIATRAPQRAPFVDVPWSTPAVLGVTIARCEAAGLRVALVDAWRDLDTAVDLDFAAAEVEAAIAPRTATLFAELRAAGAVGAPPRLRLAASDVLRATPWRTVVEDALERADGGRTGYAYLAVPRAVFVVPVTDAGEVALVRQYRHPVRDWTLEVPAGGVAEGEEPRDAAVRELREEVGGAARELVHLTTFYSSSAHLSLRSDVYLAIGVALGEPEPDPDEDLRVVRMSFAEAVALARRGRLTEGQTALAILLADASLASG
jgi:rSAM/selenodomain-associated transferase 1